jgi:hypothetical protein
MFIEHSNARYWDFFVCLFYVPVMHNTALQDQTVSLSC